MRGHTLRQWCLLHRRGLGDLVLLLVRVGTNDMLGCLGVVLVVLLCIAWSRIRFVRVPCSTPLPRRKGAACSRFVVRGVACRARVC